MASRLFWIFLVIAALVGGMAVQQGGWLFDWGHDAHVDRSIDTAVDARVDRSIEQRFDRMHVVGSNGQAIDVSPQTKRALGEAVRRLVAAETQLALAHIGDGDDVDGARSQRDAARAEVERLKGEIDRQEDLSERDRDLIREQIRQSVRETVRAAVGN